MRSMSFAATIPQIQNRTKTVTRRIGWHKLKVGDQLKAVEKAMGLKKGEKQKVLAIIEVTDVRFEPLICVTNKDVAAEGFPEMTGGDFVEFFCKAFRCDRYQIVSRIEFKYVSFVMDGPEKKSEYAEFIQYTNRLLGGGP